MSPSNSPSADGAAASSGASAGNAPAQPPEKPGLLQSFLREVASLFPAGQPNYAETLPLVAARFNGTFHDGGSAFASVVSIPHKDAEIRVRTGWTAVGRAPVSETGITLEFPDVVPFRVTAVPDGVVPKMIEGLMRIRDIFPGSDGFNGAFAVHGTPHEFVSWIFSSPQVQRGMVGEPTLRISTTADHAHASGLLERFDHCAPDGKRQLNLRVGEAILDPDRLGRLIVLTQAIYDGIAEQQASYNGGAE